MSFHTGDKKHNYFYRITNQINWKYYFGIHSTDNLDDGYMGSSKLIKDSIKKYGKENFHLTIIQDYPTRKEASDHEKLAVTMIQVEDDMCYNLRCGGDNESTFKHTVESRKKISESQIGHTRNSGKLRSEETKKRIREKRALKPMPVETREKIRQSSLGRKPTEETKERIRTLALLRITDDFREKLRINNLGENNPMFGKKHSEISLKQMRECKKRGKHNQAKKCIIFGKLYECQKDAAEDLGITENKLKRRLDSTKEKWSEYKKL